jgi:hypothetical protein
VTLVVGLADELESCADTESRKVIINIAPTRRTVGVLMLGI